jgi:hypothetical protein
MRAASSAGLNGPSGLYQVKVQIMVPKTVTSPLPYWRWIRLPADRQLERSNAAVRKAIEGFVAAARDRMQADPTLHEQPSRRTRRWGGTQREATVGLGGRPHAPCP